MRTLYLKAAMILPLINVTLTFQTRQQVRRLDASRIPSRNIWCLSAASDMPAETNAKSSSDENVRKKVDFNELDMKVVGGDTFASVDQERKIASVEQAVSIESVNDVDYFDYLKFRTTNYYLSQAAIVGVLTGLYVAVFKLSIEALKDACYKQSVLAKYPLMAAAIPAFGGLSVGLIMLLGSFPPGLGGTVKEVDAETNGAVPSFRARVRTQLNFLRKSAAAVFTLGTGCSLGPEGPCVEIGMNVARACMEVTPRRSKYHRPNWNRLLLSCGAASGVAAGFNAPITGVFFALEILQNSFNDVDSEKGDKYSSNERSSFLSATANITPILVSSVLSALVARNFLGDHLLLNLRKYSLKTPLIELPSYLLLGTVSGFVSFFFSQTAKLCKSFFTGKLGGARLKSAMQSIPPYAKPLIGGLVCGLMALGFPQILFFGYGALNPLLTNTPLPTLHLLTLLLVKTIATAICAGSGLVGGTFAPSLFLGAMIGGSFHNIMHYVSQTAFGLGKFGMVKVPILQLADVPAYAMVGAASVLAALFRAPLTASLLLFEVTRDYDVILPLMVSAGVGSVVGDILDAKSKRAKERRRRRDQDSVSWGDLASESP